MSLRILKDLQLAKRFHKYRRKLIQGILNEPYPVMDDAPRSMLMSFVSTKGLSNKAGENNCFLNSAVQILWHLDVFRKNFNQLSHHACLEDSCIFCALKVIFTQFQFSEEKVLPPDVLRKALAVSFEDQQKFQLGLMDDAAECFENILTRIHFHLSDGDTEDNCTLPHCIPHQKFAMTVIEQVVCECGETSEPLPFVQLIHYVNAHMIISLSQKSKATQSFSHKLRLAHSDGNLRNECPGKCGRQAHVERTLTNVPDVVSIGLVWDSDEQSAEQVKNFVEAIGTNLQLADLFDSVVDMERAKAREHKLVGIVCYYGKHYSAFFLHSKSNNWMSCDDATVTDVGPCWMDVIEKCCKGRYQPLLLLYQNPRAECISTKSAPKKTTILTSSMLSRKQNSMEHRSFSSAAKVSTPELPRDKCDKQFPSTVKPSAPSPSPLTNQNRNCNINNSSSSIPVDMEKGGKRLLQGSGLPSSRSSEPSRPLPTNHVAKSLTNQRIPLPTYNSKTGRYEPPSSLISALQPSKQLPVNASKTSEPVSSGIALDHRSGIALDHRSGIALDHRPASAESDLHGNYHHHHHAAISDGYTYACPMNGLSYLQGTSGAVTTPRGPVYPSGIPLYGFCTTAPQTVNPQNQGYVVPVNLVLAHVPQFSLPSSYNASLHTVHGPTVGLLPAASVGTSGANPSVTLTPCSATQERVNTTGDYNKTGNHSDADVHLLEGAKTGGLKAALDINLMEWSIIDENSLLQSPESSLPSMSSDWTDSNSTSSIYDNVYDFGILSIDDKISGQGMNAMLSDNGVPVLRRNESLTESYCFVPDSSHIDDFASDKRCKDLVQEADQLIEQSEAKERCGDLHAALICCNQATSLYAASRKEITNIGQINNVELKKKKAANRSFLLTQLIDINQHKLKSDDVKNNVSGKSSILSRAFPSQNTNEQNSLHRDGDLITLEEPSQPSAVPKYQVLKDCLPQLYGQNAARLNFVHK